MQDLFQEKATRGPQMAGAGFRSTLTRFALGMSSLVLALDACGGSLSTPGPNDIARVPAIRDLSTELAAPLNPAAFRTSPKHFVHDKIKKGSNLLYVSDFYTSDVQVYNYPPAGTQVGPVLTLTDANGPQGECTDNTGKNVFITSSRSSQILEYHYGEPKPRLVINDPNEKPVGCAVDKHGNLAVTNILTTSNDNGSISVYKAPLSASSAPTIYSNPNMSRFYFLTFDAHGNIFADGFTTQKLFGLTELAPGGTFTDLRTSNTVLFPGGVSYDASRNYVTVGDQLAQKVYGYSISGSTAKKEQMTKLRRGYDVVQYCVNFSFRDIIAPDANSYPAVVYTYRYPRGRAAIPGKTIMGYPLIMPLGCAIARP